MAQLSEHILGPDQLGKLIEALVCAEKPRYQAFQFSVLVVVTLMRDAHHLGIATRNILG